MLHDKSVHLCGIFVYSFHEVMGSLMKGEGGPDPLPGITPDT